jgi:hypothetical protein
MLARRLTYANLMSTLVVFLALGGAGVYAAAKSSQKIGSTQIKAAAITTAKLKNAAVDASRLRDGAVAEAKLFAGSASTAKLADGAISSVKIGADAVTGERVNEATLAEVPSAESGNPPVFARVNATGSVVTASSKGLTTVNVFKPPLEFGVYCISPQNFTARGGHVTPLSSGVQATGAALNLSGGPSCAAPRIQVETFVAGALADLGFYLELYR